MKFAYTPYLAAVCLAMSHETLQLDAEQVQFNGSAYFKRATPKQGVYLEFLSWKKVEYILQNSNAVLLPLGSNMKEHGLHLPLNND